MEVACGGEGGGGGGGFKGLETHPVFLPSKKEATLMSSDGDHACPAKSRKKTDVTDHKPLTVQH